MNIADFIQRGNPDGEDEEFSPTSKENQAISGKIQSKTKAKVSRNSMILIGIILLTALASLGFGLLQGKAETGTSMVVGK
jgi:hypothetical protein